MLCLGRLGLQFVVFHSNEIEFLPRIVEYFECQRRDAGMNVWRGNENENDTVAICFILLSFSVSILHRLFATFTVFIFNETVFAFLDLT